MNQNQIDAANEIIAIDELFTASETANFQQQGFFRNEAMNRLKKLRLAVEVAMERAEEDRKNGFTER